MAFAFAFTLNMFDDIIYGSLKEDAPNGDITSQITLEPGEKISGSFISKADGIICGIPIIKRTFEIIGGEFEIEEKLREGDFIKKGTVIARVFGSARTILLGERTALNLIQRASGIATATRKACEEVAGFNAKIADTRKTMPLLRALDKYAVRIGGGVNHRFGLSDGILIKDNHIKAAGSVKNAVEKAKLTCPHTLKIEVEVENLKQLEEALSAGADIIMLDNMSNALMRRAVKITNKRALLEASGNMGDKNLREVAKTGVDIISIGGLTHSVKALDISLKFD
ncbi:MAG: carboxylating nicotinate-nucleotide diphosphorylase [Eubacteriales bacterium]